MRENRPSGLMRGGAQAVIGICLSTRRPRLLYTPMVLFDSGARRDAYLGKTGTLKAFTTSCVMNALTENSSAICRRLALFWKAGVSNTMSVVRTARLAIRPRTSMPVGGRTDWMGATRPQTPRRSPRQAFGGNSEATPQGGKQTKTKTLSNLQNFSYEVSHRRAHAKGSVVRLASQL